MGFNTALAFVYPEQVYRTRTVEGEDELGWPKCVTEPTGKIQWTKFQTLDLGRTTRLEKITKYQFDFRPMERASICLTSILWTNIVKDGSQTEIAPAFAVNTSPIWEQDYIELEEYESLGSRLSRNLVAHNAMLGKGIDDRRSILDPPIMWDSAANVSRWFAEAGETEEWKALSADPMALAMAKAYIDFIAQCASAGMKVVFLFT